MNIIVTGAAGLIGSHAAEIYAQNKENYIIAIDNLSRGVLMSKYDMDFTYNWKYLKQFDNIKLIAADVCDALTMSDIINMYEPELIIHAAGQPGVPTSIKNPYYDYKNNVLGTFTMLEAVRTSPFNPTFIYTSTNKVYGENVDKIELVLKETRYEYEDNIYVAGEHIAKPFIGIPETFITDYTRHTPYGTSKLCADLYCQEYGKMYGLRTGIFRMSCIYGPRQLGIEEQGWVAHFIISAINDKIINIFGDGYQVRDMLYITDLIRAMDKFTTISYLNKGEVFNIGGGPDNTISLYEALEHIQNVLEKPTRIRFKDWRPSDQKVYISDISKAKEKLKWAPTIIPEIGIEMVIKWALENKEILK